MSFGEYDIIKGDVLEALRSLPDNTFDGTLGDYPYGLSFMAKKWDYSVPSVEVFKELLRVLKPGAPLLGFGGTRTYHRVAVNIEDAGFQLRDNLCWMYAKGFPKNQNVGLAIDKAVGAKRPVTGTRVLTGNAAVSLKDKGGTYGVQVGSGGSITVETTGPATELAKQWDGTGTALKPGWEPIILARKPLDGTMVDNVKKWGCGPLDIDECRIEAEGDDGEGRYPGNVALTHDKDCGITPHGEGCVSDCPIYMLNHQSGERLSGKAVTRNGGGNHGGALFTGRKGKASPDSGYTDNGGAARFFFSAKVSTKEREYGCEHLPKRTAGQTTGGRKEDSDGLNSPRAGAGRGDGARNHHPTLKPIALAKWLASMIKPRTRDSVLLVPYSGAGSEIIGALQAGWPAVLGIEGDFDDTNYIEIAHARIKAWGALEETAKAA